MTKTRKLWGVVAAVALCAGVLACWLILQPGRGEIRVGAVLPLTGSAAEFGNWMRQGLELALEDIRRQGILEGAEIVLVVDDSKGDPKTGLSAFRKLRSVDHIQYLFSSISGVTLAILPVATEEGVLVITSSTHPDVTSGKYLALRNYLTPAEEAVAMAKLAFHKLGFRKVGIIYLNDQSLRGYEEEFRRSFEKLGGTVLSQSYEWGVSDFRTQLTTIKSFGPEALYIGGWKEIGMILRQATELGLNVQVLGPVTFDSPKIIEIAGKASEGVIFTVPAYEAGADTGAAEAFRARYKTKFGTEPEVNVAIYYDSFLWLARTIAEVGNAPTRVREAMLTSWYDGVLGSLRFKRNGDVIMPIQFMTIRNGKFEPYVH